MSSKLHSNITVSLQLNHFNYANKQRRQRKKKKKKLALLPAV